LESGVLRIQPTEPRRAKRGGGAFGQLFESHLLRQFTRLCFR